MPASASVTTGAACACLVLTSSERASTLCPVGSRCKDRGLESVEARHGICELFRKGTMCLAKELGGYRIGQRVSPDGVPPPPPPHANIIHTQQPAPSNLVTWHQYHMGTTASGRVTGSCTRRHSRRCDAGRSGGLVLAWARR